ncbi:hypothetical protein GCM10008018_69830 [Paenibacillus marchantiophytorum]|uniref:YjzC family protein n=1 Tax=Paenibacillus marchantiophytorum TaxID=1619310 RepID=A0ABQ1FHV8_9BACL|nr:hypothetical protein GCM10008018_69830 [Paenibacillus marchantiophytorum]
MKSPVREIRTPGSVRGVPGNWYLYRDQQGLLPETVVIRHMPKYINPCEGRGTTDESPVMGVEEQPQV